MNIMNLLTGRRTYRRFDQSRPLPDEVINDIASSQRLASCARNAQMLRYVFVTSPAETEAVFAHTHWAAALPPELGHPKEGEHPVAFVVMTCAQKSASSMTYMDAGLAASNMTLPPGRTAWAVASWAPWTVTTSNAFSPLMRRKPCSLSSPSAIPHTPPSSSLCRRTEKPPTGWMTRATIMCPSAPWKRRCVLYDYPAL